MNELVMVKGNTYILRNTCILLVSCVTLTQLFWIKWFQNFDHIGQKELRNVLLHHKSLDVMVIASIPTR